MDQPVFWWAGAGGRQGEQEEEGGGNASVGSHSHSHNRSHGSHGSHGSLDSAASLASGDRDREVRHLIPPDDHLDGGKPNGLVGGPSCNRSGGSGGSASSASGSGSGSPSSRRNSDWTPAQASRAAGLLLVSRPGQVSARTSTAGSSMSGLGSHGGPGPGGGPPSSSGGAAAAATAAATAAAAAAATAGHGHEASSSSSSSFLRRDSDSSAASSSFSVRSHRRRPRFGRAPDPGLGGINTASTSIGIGSRRGQPSDASLGGSDSSMGTAATAATATGTGTGTGTGTATGSSAAGPGPPDRGSGGLLGLSSFRHGGGLLGGGGGVGPQQPLPHQPPHQPQHQPPQPPTSGGLLGSGSGLGGAPRYGGGLGLGLGLGLGGRPAAGSAGVPSQPPTASISYPRQHPQRHPQQQHQAQHQAHHHHQQQQQHDQAQQPEGNLQHSASGLLHDHLNDSATSFALPLNDDPDRPRPQPRPRPHPHLLGAGIGVTRRDSESSVLSAESDLSMASTDSANTSATSSSAAAGTGRGGGGGHGHSHSHSRSHCPNVQAGSAYLSRLLASKQRNQPQQQHQQRGDHSSSSPSGGPGTGSGVSSAGRGAARIGNLPAFGRGLAAPATASTSSTVPPTGDRDDGPPVRACDLFKAFEDDVLVGRRRNEAPHNQTQTQTRHNRRGSTTSSTGSGSSGGDLAVPPSATAAVGLNAASSMGSSSSTLLALRQYNRRGAAPAIGRPGSTFATNPPAASAGAFQRRRPRKPTSAYTYFFREKCKELAQNDMFDEYASSEWKPGKRSSTAATTAESSSMSAAAVAAAASAAVDGPTTATMSDQPAPAHSAMKRRKSDSGESIDATPRPKAVYEEDLGKVVAQMWRTMSTLEKAKYEDMADRDAERYQEEIEEYYKGSNGAMAACMMNGRAGGHPMLRISAGTTSGGAAKSGGRNSMPPRAVTVESMSHLVTTNSNTTTSIASANNPRKTALQQMLASKRTELLNDIGSLNQISSSRAAAGKPVMQQSADVRQRLYNLAVGPASSAAAGPSNWNRARLTASGVVTPTDTSPRTSLGGLATGASSPGLGLSSSLPASFADAPFGRRSSSTNVNDLAGRYMSRKSNVTIEQLDDSISTINAVGGSMPSRDILGGSNQPSLLTQALEGKLSSNKSMEPKM